MQGYVAIDATCGPCTILSREEENVLADTLMWASNRYLGVGRAELLQAVHKLCSDGRTVPRKWEEENGLSGQKWLSNFFRRNPRLSERTSRIYEANRVTADDDTRLKSFYEKWQAYLDEMKPEADHVWNTDESGVFISTKNSIIVCH